MEPIVQVVRYSNEGFDIKPYRSAAYYHTGDFFNYLVGIEELHQTVSLYKRDTDRMMVLNPEGCFAFLNQYDERQVSEDGSLSIRSNARKNMAYIRLDEVVYARNVQADMKRHLIGEIIRETPEPETGVLYQFPKSSYHDRWNWVQMPVSVFLERSKEHFMMFGSIHEIISEVFLTSEQIQRLVPTHKVGFSNLLRRKFKVIS